MFDQLREGDVVAVLKVDRLAHSTRNLLEIVEMIGNAGARAPRADAQKRGVRIERPKR